MKWSRRLHQKTCDSGFTLNSQTGVCEVLCASGQQRIGNSCYNFPANCVRFTSAILCEGCINPRSTSSSAGPVNSAPVLTPSSPASPATLTKSSVTRGNASASSPSAQLSTQGTASARPACQVILPTTATAVPRAPPRAQGPAPLLHRRVPA